MELMLIVFVLVFVVIGWGGYAKDRKEYRDHYVETYQFPVTIAEKVGEKYPHLTQYEIQLVLRGLREYFHVCNLAGRRMVSMPSQVVDVAWHEFILFTHQYQEFCQHAFGRFLHHTPAEAMRSPTVAQKGIRRAWAITCNRNGISVSSPTQLPLLFALDAQLKIEDGFYYQLDCSRSKEGDEVYCGSHIGTGGGCAGCFSDSNGCGGGCGGD